MRRSKARITKAGSPSRISAVNPILSASSGTRYHTDRIASAVSPVIPARSARLRRGYSFPVRRVRNRGRSRRSRFRRRSRRSAAARRAAASANRRSRRSARSLLATAPPDRPVRPPSHRSPPTQLASSVAPTSPDFSGWNWVAASAPCSTAATNSSPCSLMVTRAPASANAGDGRAA